MLATPGWLNRTQLVWTDASQATNNIRGSPGAAAKAARFSMIQYAVYADFNCPFCYALAERLEEHLETYDIEWRPIEHIPNTNHHPSVVDMSELASEVFTVRHRAPELVIAMPQMRPATTAASHAFVRLQNRDIGLAKRFRTRIYHALWVEDRDISQPEVIAAILDEMGGGDDAEDSDESTKLAAWQRAWESGEFNRGIPTIAASDGRVLKGLASPRDIEAFLEGKPARDAPSGVCEFVARPIVLVVGQPQDIWPLVATLTASNDVLIAVDDVNAIKQVDSGLSPDLLVVPVGFRGGGTEVCMALQQSLHLVDVPILIVDMAAGPKRELLFVEFGVSEYLAGDASPQLFKARANMHLAIKKRRDKLQEVVRLDALTRIPNRRELERVLELEWRRGIRSKLPLSVILFDIDHFKAFNDTYGHYEGDLCLVSVANTIYQCLRRASDIVARYGGEEFTVVLPNCSEQGALEIAERCRAAVQGMGRAHTGSTAAQTVTVSAGVSTILPAPEKSLRGLLDAADQRLYEAKKSGRNRVTASSG
jgi:diguanylate cyclase (GGDEF)-like protein